MVHGYKFTEAVLKQRSDVFFYWMVPDYLDEAGMAQLPQHPNIRYIKVKAHKDRTKEYLTFNADHDNCVAFNGDTWDWDILVTTRTGMTPLMKLVMSSPRLSKFTWIKEVWLLEEMPLMDFKSSVVTIDADVQDRFTIAGHLAADKVWIVSYHEKGHILRRAKDFYSPAMVQSLDKKIKSICPNSFSAFDLKKPEHFFVKGGEKPFCIAYTGRMTKTSARLHETSDVMLRQWIMRSDVRPMVCTVSTGLKVFNKDSTEVHFANREEFWKLAQEDMHVILILYTEGGFALSLFEPIMLGTPAIVAKEDWSVAMLPDYPFLAKSTTEAYGYCKRFYDDYAGMYETFRQWHQEVFIPVFKKRFETDLLHDLMLQGLTDFETRVPTLFKDRAAPRSTGGIIKTLIDALKDRNEFVLFDLIRELGASGEFKMLAQKTVDHDRDRRGLVWSSPWPDIRMILKVFYGWEDASTVTGHMKRKAA
jgi:hypothetical protein